MRAFVTGGGGFIGRHLVAGCGQSGAEVRAIARSEARRCSLTRPAARSSSADSSTPTALRGALDGCDVAFHLAGDYRVGIRRRRRPAWRRPTSPPPSACSTPRRRRRRTDRPRLDENAFGDTGYRVVDETYERPRPYRYVSFYDETKHRAHLVAHERIAAGAPVLIAMPGGVYGPGDHSSLGAVLREAATGKLSSLTFGDLGMNMAHVEDIAAGIALVGRRLGRRVVRPRRRAARRWRSSSAAWLPSPASDRRGSTPTWALRAAAPLVRRIGPDLGEIVSASAGVTYWGRMPRRGASWLRAARPRGGADGGLRVLGLRALAGGVGLDRVVEVLRQPGRDLLVGRGEPRIGDVHLGQAGVDLGRAVVEPAADRAADAPRPRPSPRRCRPASPARMAATTRSLVGLRPRPSSAASRPWCSASSAAATRGTHRSRPSAPRPRRVLVRVEVAEDLEALLRASVGFPWFVPPLPSRRPRPCAPASGSGPAASRAAVGGGPIASAPPSVMTVLISSRPNPSSR